MYHAVIGFAPLSRYWRQGGAIMKTVTCSLAAALMVIAACSHDPASPAVIVGPPAKLAFTVQPSNAAAGVAFKPAITVTIEDSSGHPVTSATNAITVAIDTGVPALSGTATVAAVNGVATFGNLSIQQARGDYFLTASSALLARATSAHFSITAAAPARLLFAVQPSSSWPAQLIAPAVWVTMQDAFGNAVTSATNPVTIAIGANPTGGTLSGTTTVSAVGGVATFGNLAIDRSGSGYTLVVSAPGLTGAASNAFAIHATWALLSAGAWHTCGLTPGGAAYCWGWNLYGQLGNGALIDASAPLPVSGGLRFVAVSGGGAHTCGLVSGGVAYCWGNNSYGQIGKGDTIGSATPFAVSGGLTFAAVSAGSEYHSCGLTTAGAAYCWGNNSFGQLGKGDTVGSAVPALVSAGLSFAAVSAGSHHACGITTGGAAYCWGNNSYGQLGKGDTASSAVPVAVSGGLTFAALHAGYFETCGVTPAGAVYCWGRNDGGGLGNGTTTNSTVPVAVSGGPTFAGLNVGDGHVCGVTPNGVGYCWGNSGNGQLGNGSTTSRLAPIGVATGLTFAAMSAGAFHTCGLTTRGGAYCWGNGNHGQLGNPPTWRTVCGCPLWGCRIASQWRCDRRLGPVPTPVLVSDPPALTTLGSRHQ
jgi:alpha-tubulin suppressor-like RCC1 family protein